MQKPAVISRKWTAGKPTSHVQKITMLLLCLAAAALLCAFSPAVQAQATEAVTKMVTAMQKIPFGTRYIDAPDQYKGYTRLVSEGVMGARKMEAQVLYRGTLPIQVLSIKTESAGLPVDQVVQRGSKVLRSRRADGQPWEVSFAHPLKDKGWLSGDFYDYPGHNGIDLAAPYGTPVYAAAEGKVSLAGWYGEYGRCVIIDHADGSQTLYAHNSALTVRSGQTVLQGQQIAQVGSTGNSTGNHLHFELRVNGEFLDPLVYMDQ